MQHTRKEQMEAFGRFLDILDELRVKCPWDKKQTNESLRPNTIEETYELCDALMRDDKQDICKELGDVLLHVAFYAKIGSETGDFDIKDVCNRLWFLSGNLWIRWNLKIIHPTFRSVSEKISVEM